MKKPLNLLVISILLLAACSYAGIDPSNKLKLGDGTATDKTIEFNTGATATSPKFKWNSGTSKLQIANDGSTYTDIPTSSAAATDMSSEISNLGLTATVAANALTISLKDKSGATPSAGSSVKIGFRNATLATGQYSQVTVTAATTVVVSSGSTLGQSSGVAEYVYVYALNNAGTVELAVSTLQFVDQGSVYTSTAEGGAGAADSRSILYSTTARSNVAIRLIGRVKSTQTTAGTWAAAPTEISLTPFGGLVADGWHIDANIGGAGVVLSSGSVTTYTGLTNAGLDLVTNPGSHPVNIACAGTTAATGATCSGADESVGISFDAPLVGAYQVCFSVGHLLQSSGGDNQTTFQLVETPNNAQTISQEGHGRVTGSRDQNSIFPRRDCGVFIFSTVGTKTIRLFYEQAASTIAQNSLQMDRDANIGQRDLHAEVYLIR